MRNYKNKVLKYSNLLMLFALLFTMGGCSSKDGSREYKKALKLINKGEYNDAFELLLTIDKNEEVKNKIEEIKYDITDVTLPEGIEVIEKKQFENCINLKNIVLPEGLNKIDEQAFNGCKNLKTITLPDTISFIGESAFRNCSSLASITLPNSLTNMGESVFRYCNSLTIYCEPNEKPKFWQKRWNDSDRPTYWGINESNYIEKDGLEYVIRSNNAILSGYYGDDSKVVIPSKVNNYEVNEIGAYAFSYRYYLKSVLINNSIDIINENAFRGAENLILYCESEKVLDGWDEHWNASNLPLNFGVDKLFEKDGYEFVLIDNEARISRCIADSDEVVIPSSVEIDNKSYNITSIGEAAFYKCNSIKKLTFPNTLKTIGSYSFSGCERLEQVVLNEGLVNIDSYAFYNCRKLKNINLPSTLKSIQEKAFFSCVSLEYVVIPLSVVTIGDNAFRYCSSLTIFIEAESKVDTWSNTWNYSYRPTYYAGKWEYVNGVPTLKK